MNTGIRRVGIVMIVLFVGLVAQLTYLQVGRASRLDNDPRNARKFLRDIQRNRGPIVSGDGVILAKSVPSNDEYKYQRVYPEATAASVRARRRLPVDPIRIGRRREHVFRRSCRPHVQAAVRQPRRSIRDDTAGRHGRPHARRRGAEGRGLRAAGAEGKRRRARRADRWRACDVFERHVQSEPARITQHREGAQGPRRPAQGPRESAARARVARDLPTRFHVQDGDGFDRAPAQRRRHHRVPATARASAPADNRDAAQLR